MKLKHVPVRRGGTQLRLLSFAIALMAQLCYGIQARAQEPPDWSMYQYNVANNGVVSASSPASRWKFDTGGKINGGLSFHNGVVFFESFDGYVYALNAANGSVKWRHNLAAVAMNAPLVTNGRVIVGTGTNAIMRDSMTSFVMARPEGDFVAALDEQTGKPIWTTATVGQNMPTGVITNVQGKAAFVFPSGTGELLCVDAISGRLIWRRVIPGVDAMASLAVENGVIYGSSQFSSTFARAAYNDNDTNSFDRFTWTWAARVQDGQLIWIAPYGSGDSSPAIGDGIVLEERSFFKRNRTERGSDIDGTSFTTEPLFERIYGIRKDTGELAWQLDGAPGNFTSIGTNEGSIAGVFADHVFYESLLFSNSVVAISAVGGRSLWKTDTHGQVKMSGVVVGDSLLIGDSSGYLYSIDTHSGKIRTERKFPEPFTCSPPIVVGDEVFLANGKSVYALPLQDLNQPLAAPPSNASARHL